VCARRCMGAGQGSGPHAPATGGTKDPYGVHKAPATESTEHPPRSPQRIRTESIKIADQNDQKKTLRTGSTAEGGPYGPYWHRTMYKKKRKRKRKDYTGGEQHHPH